MGKWTAAALKRSISAGDVKVASTDPPKKAKKTKPPQKMTAAQKEKRDAEYRKWEEAFAGYWVQLGGDARLLVQQYPFRRWKFDFAILELKILIEIDGGTWTRGKSSHNWGPGIRRQCLKQNAAVAEGWRPFRYTADMLTQKEAPIQIGALLKLVQRELKQNQRYIMKEKNETKNGI